MGTGLKGDHLEETKETLMLLIAPSVTSTIMFNIQVIVYILSKEETVAVYSEFGKKTCHFEHGDFFGEISLVMKRKFRCASAVVLTNCEIFKLGEEDFDSSIACYAIVYDDIKKVAISKFERICVLDEHRKTDIKINEVHKYREQDGNP